MHARLCSDVGLLGYGHYIPPWRLDVSEFARQWDLPASLERAYRLSGRNRVAVAADDEDAITLAIAAASRARAATGNSDRIDALLFGSESHPYAVKSSAVVVAEAIGIAPDAFVVDLEFACRGGSAALLLSATLSAGAGACAMAIGADCPQSRPGSLLEASVGAAACAFIVGRGPATIARIDAIASAATDLTDFWRRDGARYPSVVGKLSMDEGYLAHSKRVAHALMDVQGAGPGDFQYAVFHQPYATLPARLGKELGFTSSQIKPGLTAARIGNSYSAACLLGLCHVLDIARPGERILLVSFGSGAGSDGVTLEVTDRIDNFHQTRTDSSIATVNDEISGNHTQNISYGLYAQSQGKLQ